jgi:hypothetical protein
MARRKAGVATGKLIFKDGGQRKKADNAALRETAALSVLHFTSA